VEFAPRPRLRVHHVRRECLGFNEAGRGTFWASHGTAHKDCWGKSEHACSCQHQRCRFASIQDDCKRAVANSRPLRVWLASCGLPHLSGCWTFHPNNSSWLYRTSPQTVTSTTQTWWLPCETCRQCRDGLMTTTCAAWASRTQCMPRDFSPAIIPVVKIIEPSRLVACWAPEVSI